MRFDCSYFSLFFFNDTATTEIYTLSLHDALPISSVGVDGHYGRAGRLALRPLRALRLLRGERHEVERVRRAHLGARRRRGDQVHPAALRRELPVREQHLRRERAALGAVGLDLRDRDRKSTRLNSSHLVISYAVFCLKKKKTNCDPKAPHE